MKVVLVSESDQDRQNELTAAAMRDYLKWDATAIETCAAPPTAVGDAVKGADLVIFQNKLLAFRDIGTEHNTIIYGVGASMKDDIRGLFQMAVNGGHILPPRAVACLASAIPGNCFETLIVPITEVLQQEIAKPAEYKMAVYSREDRYYGYDELCDLVRGKLVLANLSAWCYTIHPDLPIWRDTPGYRSMAAEQMDHEEATDTCEMKTYGRATWQTAWVTQNCSARVVAQKWETYVHWVMHECQQ